MHGVPDHRSGLRLHAPTAALVCLEPAGVSAHPRLPRTDLHGSTGRWVTLRCMRNDADVLDVEQRRFIEERRTATLATISDTGQPRLVPICFVLAAADAADPSAILYSPLDEKPKRGADVRDLARVRDIVDRPEVTLLFDRWDEDWSRLAWLRCRGTASLLEPGEDAEAHAAAVELLRSRYPQYRGHAIDALPMIRIDIADVVWWEASRGSTGS